MTIRGFLLVLAVAMGIQATAFSRRYADLLYLRRPADALAQAPPGEFRERAEAALSRSHLTRRHLEQIADAARRGGQRDLEVRALERLAALVPSDVGVELRLADAWRRAGRLGEAEALYQHVLWRVWRNSMEGRP